MKIFFLAVGALVVFAIAGMFLLPQGSGTVRSNSDVIATNGMHWHPQLTIYVKDKPVEIPQNVGIGAVHKPMHTHDDLPLIHLEFPGIVRKDDIMLGRFFEIWGKDMNSFGPNMRMTVNGAENTEYESFVMHDGDKIVLYFD